MRISDWSSDVCSSDLIVQLGAGTWTLTDGLSLDVANVTVRGAGAGEDGSILDFAGQQGAGEGLLVTSDDVLLTEFAVLNTKGDGIKSKGADRIVYHKLRVEWTAGPKATNGAHGIYPVESTDEIGRAPCRERVCRYV